MAGLIHLVFKGATPVRSATLGPARRFRVAGNFIRDADSGQILARYHNHFWDVQHNPYTGYDCLEPVLMRFEDAEGGSSDSYGPIFDELRNDPALFASITVDPRAGTIVWSNGADIDPDVLCQGLTPAWREHSDQLEMSTETPGKTA